MLASRYLHEQRLHRLSVDLVVAFSERILFPSARLLSLRAARPERSFTMGPGSTKVVANEEDDDVGLSFAAAARSQLAAHSMR